MLLPLLSWVWLPNPGAMFNTVAPEVCHVRVVDPPEVMDEGEAVNEWIVGGRSPTVTVRELLPGTPVLLAVSVNVVGALTVTATEPLPFTVCAVTSPTPGLMLKESYPVVVHARVVVPPGWTLAGAAVKAVISDTAG